MEEYVIHMKPQTSSCGHGNSAMKLSIVCRCLYGEDVGYDSCKCFDRGWSADLATHIDTNFNETLSSREFLMSCEESVFYFSSQVCPLRLPYFYLKGNPVCLDRCSHLPFYLLGLFRPLYAMNADGLSIRIYKLLSPMDALHRAFHLICME